MNKSCLLGSVFAAIVTLFASVSANASLVTWTLNDVTFNDDGMATGYFIFDNVAEDIAGYNIVTTSGTVLSGTTYDSTGAALYTPDCVGSGTTCLNFSDGSPASHQLAFYFTGLLTDNTSKVIPAPPTSEGGFDEVSTDGEFLRQVNQSWSLHPSPVPIPTAVWLFGSGLLGMIGIARRKKAA